MAIIDRNPAPGLIFHSDNGANFTSYTFTTYSKECGIKQSFSRVHNPYDNSVCESFFKTLKQEEIYRKDYRSEKERTVQLQNLWSSIIMIAHIQ